MITPSSDSFFTQNLKQEKSSPPTTPAPTKDINLEKTAKSKLQVQHSIQKKSLKPIDEIIAKKEEKVSAQTQEMLKQVQKKAPNQSESVGKIEEEKAIQPNNKEKLKKAIKEQDQNTVKELLSEKGIDLNIKFDDGTTPMTLAIACFNNEVVELLTTAGFDVNEADAKGDFPFLVAIQNHNIEVVQNLLRNPLVDVDVQNRQGHTALIMGSFAGSEELVQGLLQRNVEIDKPNNEKQTALIAAAAQGNDRIVDLLINNGANPSAQDSTGTSALIASAFRGHEKCVQLILKTNIKPDEATALKGYTALHAAAKNGNPEIIKHLIQAGADPHKISNLGESPICFAAAFSQKSAYEAMISETNLEKLSIEQKQNLIVALATGGLDESLESLLNSTLITLPSDINFVTQDGQTPLMFAAFKGHKEVMNLLIKRGAKVGGVQDSFGQDPLIKAAISHSDFESLNHMMENGADLSHRDLNGFTASDYYLLLYHDDILYNSFYPENLVHSLVHFKLIDQPINEKDWLKEVSIEQKKEWVIKLKEALDSKRSEKLHIHLKTPIDQPVMNSINDLHIKLKQTQYDIEELRLSHIAAHSKLQIARMSGSTTMTIGLTSAEEKELAINNWKKADDTVRNWAQKGETLTSDHLCELNKILNQKNPTGAYRIHGITAGGHISKSYVPANEIEAEIEKFTIWLDQGIKACEKEEENPIILATLAYQWLVSVHPFNDGNGRTCRMIMDYVLQRFGLPPSSPSDVNVAIFALTPGGISPSNAVKLIEQGLINSINIFNEAKEL